MRKVYAIVIGALLVLAASAVAAAQPKTTFVAHLTAAEEVPGCPAGVESGARGVAVIQVNAETGEITYKVVATNLPGTITGAHIHIGGAGETGGVVLPLALTGLERGLVAAGSANDPDLAAAILADPANYYVNVHTTTCPEGAIRGQLG